LRERQSVDECSTRLLEYNMTKKGLSRHNDVCVNGGRRVYLMVDDGYRLSVKIKIRFFVAETEAA
jgi:hypothetical protein